MNFILIGILVLLIIWISILIGNLIYATKGFGLLLEKFVEENQSFYEGQKNIFKKDKEILEGLVKQTVELSIMRKYSSQMSMVLKNVSEVTRSLKDTQKNINSTIEELKVSKDIAGSLATVSNNISILDKVVVELKRTIDDLKKEIHNAK